MFSLRFLKVKMDVEKDFKQRCSDKIPFTTWNMIPEGVAGIGMFLNHNNKDPNAIPGKYWT